jgi:O-antigen/teichoic acid export membrane protein
MNIREEAGKKADILTKKFGFDVRFYGRSFTWLSMSHASTLLRGFASTYLVALWVAPEILGQFRYILMLYGLAGIFAFTGYGSCIIKGLARGETTAVRNAIKRVLTYAPLGSIVLCIGAIDRMIHGEQDVAVAIIVSAIAFVPYTLSSFYVNIYTGLEKIKTMSRTTIWSNVLYAIIFIAILSWSKNIIIITSAYFFIDIVIRGWMTWRAYQSIPHESTSTETYEALGRHLNGINIMHVIAESVGLILLQRFWGYTALAVFSIAMILPEQLMNLAKTMNGTILQRLSRKELNPKSLINIQRQFKTGLIVSLGIVVAYALFAPIIIPLFFPQYPSAVLPSIVYAIGLVSIPCLIGTNFFQANLDYRRIWRYQIVFNATQFLTSIILIPWIGNWGAIWSRVLTRTVSLPLSYPIETKSKE